ncbi:F-box family protein [Rhynchospora pubera]|uniref:F-box family protein n=1 Tax=Rhynchospora pubera TaxID=906938 RepID=A0AAV8HMG8_9POAL|nr:F-box family protein [Rhynchospora pubera]
MDGSASVYPDWSHLPQLVVQLISEKVKSIIDYVRFRAVCQPWRSASLSKPCHLPPQLPWLIKLQWYIYGKKDDGIRLFYDPWESKIHKIHLPETNDMNCYASYRGWLLIAATGGRSRKVFLINPLTRSRIDLPPFITPVKHLGGFCDNPCDVASYPYIYFSTTCKMTFSMDLTDPDCLVMLFLSWQVILCCKVGDPCWTQVDVCFNSLGNLIDVTYYNGRFYLLHKKAMEIIESNKPKERTVYNFEPKIEAIYKYLLEGKSGVYIIACNFFKYDLYQFEEKPLKLKQIKDTSNTIFFLDRHLSLALCSDVWNSLDGGSRYMEDFCKPPAWGQAWTLWFQPSFL